MVRGWFGRVERVERIGGLGLSNSRRGAERQRAQRVFGSCDFARGIAVELEDWGIGGLEDWGIGELGDLAM